MFKITIDDNLLMGFNFSAYTMVISRELSTSGGGGTDQAHEQRVKLEKKYKNKQNKNKKCAQKNKQPKLCA